MKKLLILLIITSSINIRSQQDILSMRCITAERRIPVTIYSKDGIRVTPDVDHIDLRPGDLIVVPKLSEGIGTSPAVEVFHSGEGGG